MLKINNLIFLNEYTKKKLFFSVARALFYKKTLQIIVIVFLALNGLLPIKISAYVSV